MADPKIPSFIKVDPQALNLLAQMEGVQEAPAIEIKGEDCLLQRVSWEQWTSKNQKAFEWPSFVELFKAQDNDDMAASLSIEDLQLKRVSHPKQKNAEMTFVKAHGYPEAVMRDGSRQIVRMSDGQFWMGYQEGGKYTFKQMARHEGREMETRIANAVLENLDLRFNRASPAQRLLMKRTMGSSRSAAISSGGGGVHRFADNDYRLGNSNARIAYKPGNDIDCYFLSQPQNGCIAASILNGAIFSGAGITRTPAILTKFYEKLKGMQGSMDGRIDVDRLVRTINGRKIPGMTAQQVSAEEVEGFVRAKKPVIALVPYFSGHAFLVTDVNAEAGYYKAVDTVSGMMVQESYQPLSKTLLFTAQRLLEAMHASLDLMHVEVSMRAYYSFEIQDAKKFLAWLDS